MIDFLQKAGKSIEDELELPVPSTTLRTSTLAPQKQITEVPLTPADGPVRKVSTDRLR